MCIPSVTSYYLQKCLECSHVKKKKKKRQQLVPANQAICQRPTVKRSDQQTFPGWLLNTSRSRPEVLHCKGVFQQNIQGGVGWQQQLQEGILEPFRHQVQTTHTPWSNWASWAQHQPGLLEKPYDSVTKKEKKSCEKTDWLRTAGQANLGLGIQNGAQLFLPLAKNQAPATRSSRITVFLPLCSPPSSTHPFTRKITTTQLSSCIVSPLLLLKTTCNWQSGLPQDSALSSSWKG